MAHPRPTRAQLLAEVAALRQHVAQLTAAALQQTVEALQRAPLYAQSIVETVREPLVVLGPDLRVLCANRAFYRFFHTTPQETEQTLFSDLSSGQWNVPSLRQRFEALLSQNTPVENVAIEITLPSGTRKTVQLQARRIEPCTSHPPMILLTLEDLTERRRAERLSQHQDPWLDVTLTSIGDAVIATDTEAVITFMNPAAERLTGWPAQVALGRPVEEVVRLINPETQHAVESPIRRVLREGTVVGLANHTGLLARDGREIPVADSGAPIREQDSTLSGGVMVFRDMTEREELEQRLRHAQERAAAASRVQDELLATMSHEVRAPLSVIRGYIDLLQDGAYGPVPPEQTDILRRIDRNASEVLDLVSSVLEMQRLEGGQLQVTREETQVADVLQALEEELEDLRAQSGLLFTWLIGTPLPPIHTDVRKLKTVLKNLVGNAVKFTAQGRITVEAQRTDDGVEIRVTDTGRGIPPEVLPHIFAPFYRAPDPVHQPTSGAGLGLHIVQRFVEVLGGSITVESELGRGSTFRVHLPAAT